MDLDCLFIYFYVQLFSFAQQLSKSLKIFFKRREAQRSVKVNPMVLPQRYTSYKFSDHPYRQDRMGKMPTTRQLRASVSFPIIELGLQEALEGESFAKARRLHKSG